MVANGTPKFDIQALLDAYNQILKKSSLHTQALLLAFDGLYHGLWPLINVRKYLYR